MDDEALVTEPHPRLDESSSVERWRLLTLIDAGYPVASAEQIAVRMDIDLHRAVDLIVGGCSFELAARILI